MASTNEAGTHDAARLLRTVAEAANLARTPDEAVRSTLEAVCAHTGWPVGHAFAWSGERGVLEPIEVWWDPGGVGGPLRDATAALTLRPAEGLPGRALATGTVVIVEDVSTDPSFLRADAARAAGLRGGLAFPVMVGSSVAAVLELYTPAPGRLDAEGLDVLAQVGLHLGRVIERAHAEAELRFERRRVAGILETAADAYVAMDRQGRICGWNRQAETLLGWTAAEAQGRSLAETLIPPRHREAHEHGVARYLSTGESRVQRRRMELEALHRDGHEIPIELVVWATPDVEDRLAFHAFLHDVTERRAADEALRRLNQDLAAANRDLESFNSMASHDLRAPVRAVAGFARLLETESDQELGPRARERLARIQAAASRMDRLIDDLLQLSRVARQDMDLAIIDLGTLAGEIFGELREQDPGRRVDARATLGATAAVDPGLARILLTNLLSNAWKFTRPRAEPRVEFGIAEHGAFFVRDNGVGFDMKHANQLFLPFHRLHGSGFEGTGIGLAIAHRVVTRHGGRIWVEAAPDLGATFFFTLARQA